jgi:hypothetical protein
MSQESDPGTPLPTSPMAASILSGFRQPPQSLFHAVEGFVDFNAALHDLDREIADAKADADTNTEQEAFLALPPSNDTFDNDNVFSVGAESQFSDSTPPTPSKNLQTQLEELRILMGTLKSSIPANGQSFFEYLNQYKFQTQIQIYGNHPIVETIGQNMLVPMLSFYGITTKDGVASIKPNIGQITTDIESMVARIFIPTKVGLGPSTAQQAVGFEELIVDCPMPTATNLCWNVRLTLNGNIFTLLTFRIVAMTNVNFEPQQSPLSTQNQYIHLCFALLSKACAKDFNCLCSMPEIDVGLFNIIVQSGNLAGLFAFIEIFLKALAEPQLDSKRSYMVTALHNLVSSFEPSQTGETLAYKNLFDGDIPGSGLNTFNPIMREINKVIIILRDVSAGQEELQVSLCGGRMIYKLGDVLRDYVTQGVDAALGPNAEFLLAEMVKPLNLPSDSDYTLTFGGVGSEDLDVVQTHLMFYTLCSQLGIKKIIDEFCTSDNLYAGFFLKERVVVGMSLVGGDFQLSSARNSCEALAFLDEINSKIQKDPSLEILHPSLEFLQQFPRDLKRVPKSSLAPCDLVPKIKSGNFIVKIGNYIFSSGYVHPHLQGVMIQIVPNINTIADRISRYSMSTDQGFSSPIKVLFDILFTLFSIENFTNRAFVTQKINKELKRIAICASILFFHFNELLQMPRLYPEGSPQRREITTMLEKLGLVINYGYSPAVKLLSGEIHNIMTAYASCFVQLLHLYHLGVVFYSRVPDATLPTIGPRNTLTRLETACMDMLKVYAPVAQDLVPRQPQEPFQVEGLPHQLLTSIITSGRHFLATIQTNGILQNFLQLKQKVKTKDSEYKAEGKFLTSVEAFEFFLQGFPKIEQPFPIPALPALPGFVTILTHPTLFKDLQPLLDIFHSNPGFAELMHFEPIVVIKSENLIDAAKANPANAEGLKVSGQHQFGIYALLSIFGVKFKSEWSKIALFTRMLFRELFSRGMNDACQRLLGVNLGNIDPTKYRTSYENYEKDVALFRVLQSLGIAIESLPSLSTYYGRGNVHHGVNVYFNPVPAATNFQFIFPDNPQPNDELLSFRFLSPEILQQLMTKYQSAFSQLLAQGALQPRAYEFLVDRLLQKFSNLTKECDENVTEELKKIDHRGRPSKDIKVQRKLREVDAFIGSLIPLSQQPNGSDEFISQLMASPLSACFEGKKDADKFEMLSDEQRMQWLEHLTSMITFLITNSAVIDPDHQRLVKYSKLLLLLKKYIPPPPQAAMQQAAMQQAAMQQAAMQQAAMQQAAMQQAAMQQAAMQQAAPALPPPSFESAALAFSAKGTTAKPESTKLTKSGAINRPQASQGAAAGVVAPDADAAVAAALSSIYEQPIKHKGQDKGKGSKGTGKGKRQGGGSPKASVTKTKPKTRNNNRYSKNARTRKNKHKRKQHRNRKYKKTSNTKSNRRTKPQSKKNITFKRRRR